MSGFINTTNGTTLPSDCVSSGIIWKCTVFLSFIFAFPGAVVILFHMCSKISKGTSLTAIDVFVINLVVLDVTFLLLLQPDLYVNVEAIDLAYSAFFSFLLSLGMCGRPLFLTCICLECYLAVVHPLTYRTRKSRTPCILVSVAVWIVTVGFGLYFAISRMKTYELPSIAVMTAMLPVITFCDVSILWTLKRSGPTKRRNDAQKKRVLQSIFNNFVITLISYLPPIFSWSTHEFLNLNKATFSCFVFIPAMCFTIAGNTVSTILHVNNIGKLDWLKPCKQK